MDPETLHSHRRSVPKKRRCTGQRIAGAVIALSLVLVGVSPGVAQAADRSHAASSSALGAVERRHAAWQPLTPGVRPGARAGASLAYDRKHRILVLWGGGEPTGGLSAAVSGDTWAFNGSTWHQLPTGPARIRSSLVFDPRISSFVTFGGSSPTGVTGDTWTFDGSKWTQIAVSGPPAREGASMAYDPRLHEIVLFGGDTNTAAELGDTWAWKPMTGWTRLSPHRAPGVRFGSSMVFDPRLGKLVLFGGEGVNGIQNDTWTFDGSTWEQLVTTTSPASRVQQSMTYDRHLHAVVLFGGVGPRDDLGDTWLFTGSKWTQLAVNGIGPGRVQGQESSLAYDPAIRTTILLGGGDIQGQISGDEWALR
jgi:hypothetical protein